jgi:tetratricopeptide (TPR) repeat protein
MKKIFVVFAVILAAYLTVFYTKGKQNGYNKPFNMSFLDSLFASSTDESFKLGISGKEYLDQKNYDKALDIFLDALNEENNAENNYLVGHSYLLKEDYDNALFYCGNAIIADARYADAYLDRGKIYYYKGLYDQAVKDLYFSIELIPQNAEAFYFMGLSYEAQNQLEIALQTYETAAGIDSLNTDYLFKTASLAFDIENFDKATKYYKSVLIIDSLNRYSLLNLGLTYSKRGFNDTALIYYDKVITYYPDYALAYNNKGYVLQTRKKYAQAIELYEKSIELDPTGTRYYWNRAECLKILKEYSKAIDDYKKIYEINNQYYNTLFLTADCYEKLNLNAEAKEYYLKYKAVATSESEYFNKIDEKLKKFK